MNTSILTMVLTGALLAGQNAAPSWQTSYSKAHQQGVQLQKPLVVVFGSGGNGVAKLIGDGTAAAEVNQLLADKYVCVYIDTTSAAGKQLAASFEITGGVGMVISDRTGSLQAFWHQGDMTSQQMVRSLQKYSMTDRVIRSTENGSTVRSSFYPSEVSQGGIPGLSLPGSSYCPTCNGGGRSRR